MGSRVYSAHVVRQVNSPALEDKSRPVRLNIPKLSIDATVELSGVAADGSMGAPKDPANVAWFDRGVRPGQNGAAVIDGHFGWKNNTPAAFDHLSDLRKGDEIIVTDGTGTTNVFVVRELRVYKETDDASGVFSSTDGKAHLNLITCDGFWSNSQKSYSNRLVVFADKK